VDRGLRLERAFAVHHIPALLIGNTTLSSLDQFDQPDTGVAYVLAFLQIDADPVGRMARARAAMLAQARGTVETMSKKH
jgi:hypothetical protein